MATLTGSGIGGYNLASTADQVIAYDYDGIGKLDHLACYRPGTGTIWILKKPSASDSPDAFSAVYHQGDPGQGIAGYNLASAADRVIAYDYDGTGKLDHLACYRPGTGTIWILKKVSGSDSPNAFSAVYHQGDPGQGIGGYNLASAADQVIAYDYDGTGKLDHLVCYRPGTGMIRILKKVSNNDSLDAFATVYHGGGIGGYDLAVPADRVIAYDYDGTGKLDHLVCYRPGTGTIWILKKVGNDDNPDAFAIVYHGSGIGGYDLASAADQVIAYDYDGTGKLDHLVCYRPGTGAIWIVKKVSASDSPGAFSDVYHQGPGGKGIGGFDLSDSGDRLFAFDGTGTGKVDHLVCYRPGTGVIRILKKVSNDNSPYAFEPVYPALFAPVAALFAALPDRGANVAGNAARAGLLNILRGGTPGSFPTLTRTISYRDAFFPSYVQGPPLPPTGQGVDWWIAFNVVVICQAIYYIVTGARDLVRQPDVNNQVTALNGALRANLNFFYAGVLAEMPGTPLQPVFAPILASAAQAQAAQMYVSLLENPAWVSAKVGQATSGQWTDADWELLHHWLKLYALGMTAAQIDAVIQALVAGQLPVPSEVGAGNWPSCTLWLTSDSIDWNDIRAEVTPGMLAAWDPHGEDEASCDFMNAGPGNQWSTHPNTSCFAAGAKVLMADGTLKNIETITRGDMVQSITGPRAVVTAVSLRHQGDRLYSFAGTDLRFSATHPFLTLAGASGQPGAAVAGVEPTWLMRAMPGVASRGVARLGPSGPPLAGFAGGVHPVRPGALQEHKVTPGVEMIYDLVTAFDGQGESHYCVGDGRTTFAVTSETPRFAAAPPAAAAIMDIMAAAWPAIAHAMQPVPAAQWRQVLDRALRRIALSLVPTVTADPTAEPEVMPDGWSTGPHLAATAHGLAAAVMTGGPQAATYDNNRGACLGAIVTALGNLVRDGVATGWRVFLGADAVDAPLHAVSALSFEVTGDAAPRSDGALTAEMVIGEGTSAAHHVLPAFPSNGQPVFFQQIADVAYVPRLQAKPGAPIALRVAFRDGAGNRLPLYGVTWLPDMTAQAYRRISVPLFDTEGTPLIVGQFLIDVRSANDASRAEETAARAAWTSAKATRFAHVLGRRIGAHLVAEFPAALAAVRT